MALLSGASLDAHALALGEINVYSALGQPFRAEVDITQLSPAEANGLKAAIASRAAYQSAGVEYNPVVGNIRVSVQKRPNGKTYLRLTSQTPIHEPYLGIVVDTSWSTGRVVRDFTVLLDPPEARRAPVEVVPAQTTQAAPVAAPTPVTPVATPAQSAEYDAEREARLARARAQVERAASASTPAPAATASESGRPARAGGRGGRRRANLEPRLEPATTASGDQVTVSRGDTAGRIAAAHLPANVSLDQMLVAMLRANPNAFVGGNVNRLRAGAVITLPTAEEAAAVAPRQARQTIIAQSRDFNRYRQGLGRSAPRVAAAPSGQTASGAVQSEVKAPATTTADGSKLIVDASTKDSRKAQLAAKAAEQKELDQRKAELERTRKELEALKVASQAASSTETPALAPQIAASAPGLAVSVPAPVANVTASAATAPAPASEPAAPAPVASAPAVLPTEVASAAQAASEAAEATLTAASEAAGAASEAADAASEAASAAVTPPPKPAPRIVPPPPPPPEPSFLDGVMENPLPWGLGALAVLGGLGFLASRARRKKDGASDDGAADSEFLESRLQPDSFFNASGGQQVNTQEPRASTSNATSMAYSPSQLDAAGDVDPVAEADVYLAYGRDLQAEEILKEALVETPERIAIYRKLLEIYAKRRDTKAFAELAKDLRERTDGQGEDWIKVAELGNELDPGNPLYTTAGAANALLTKDGPVNAPVFGSSTLPSPDHGVVGESKLDLELNGDSRLLADDEEANLRPKNGSGLATFAAPPETKAPEEAEDLDQPLAFDLDFDAAPTPVPTMPAPLSNEPSTAPATLRPDLNAQEGMLEFDMGALSIDPDSRSFDVQDSVAPDDDDEDPLATKLSLAREFHAIGDIDGARAMVTEVIAEADGALKARAERFLAELQ